MNTRPEDESQILVAQDRPDAVAMDIVRCLFNESFRHLRGLFIEDPQLFEHARSRLAREVLMSGMDRALEAAALARQLRAQAAEVRKQFESHASKLGVPFSFQVMRGEPLPEIARVATGSELVIVSLSHESPESSASWTATIRTLEQTRIQTLLLARRGWQTGSAILAVIEDSSLARPTARLASRLAEKSGSVLTTLMESEASAEPAESREQKPTSRDEHAPLQGRLQLVAKLDPDAIVSAALREKAKLVILPWRNRPADAEILARLLKQTGSAVLLLK